MQLLISVAGPAEARAALRGGADVIDAKDPRRGALGPVSLQRLAAIRAAVAGGLSGPDLARARSLGADVVGVRGAACVGGRTGRVSRARVAALRALAGAAPSLRVPIGRGLLPQRDVELAEIVGRDDEVFYAVRERA